jgi:flavin-dependent dehydrogenase
MMEMKKAKTEYDVIVVGAGLAGAMAAYKAAKDGASVLMVEKHPEIGVPVRCAEGISEPVVRIAENKRSRSCFSQWH